MWGFDPLKAARAPLLDALERGPGGAPAPAQASREPAGAGPAHPDLLASRVDSDLVADCLGAWAEQWQGALCRLDTSSGRDALTDGAMQVADLVVVPVVLGRPRDGRP